MKLATQIKRFVKQILGFFPSPLPQGIEAFEAWAQDIQDTYNLPTTNKDSVRFTLASAFFGLGNQTDWKPKYFFVKTLRAGAAKQIAGFVFSEIKYRQEDAMKAEKAAAAEAAANASKS